MSGPSAQPRKELGSLTLCLEVELHGAATVSKRYNARWVLPAYFFPTATPSSL